MNETASGTIEISYDLKHNYYIPSEILNLPNIYGTNLEKEASIIQDGLEARTNGMYDRDRPDPVDSIPPASPLYPWRLLLQALSALYEGRTEDLEKIAGRIPGECGPEFLLNVISALGELPGGKEKRSGFSRPEKVLYNLVSEDRRFVKSVIMQLADSIEAGEDYFFEFAFLAIREIREMDEEACHRFTLWCLYTAYLEDYDYTLFLETLKTLFPPALVMRFSAIVLTSEDPEEGVKCWLLSLIFRIREGNLSKTEASEYLHLISGMLREVIPTDGSVEGKETGQILTLLQSELSAFFRISLAPYCGRMQPAHYTEVWAVTLDPSVMPEFSHSVKEKSSGGRKADQRETPQQLELFEEEPETCGPDKKDPEGECGIPGWDISADTTRTGLLSPRPLESPEELKDLLRSRPRYVGPEPWLEVILKKRKKLLS